MLSSGRTAVETRVARYKKIEKTKFGHKQFQKKENLKWGKRQNKGPIFKGYLPKFIE
jgi:hypothetical protein